METKVCHVIKAWTCFQKKNLKGLCHRYRYMHGLYGDVYDYPPTLSISIQIARTKNMRMYCGQHRGTSNPVSCDIAPLIVDF